MASPVVVLWPFAHETIPLEAHQVHLWCAVLRDFESVLPRFEAVLSSAERARAKEFRFSRDRTQFIIRHGIRRELLGRYLKRHPSEIDFCYGPSGKPGIKNGGSPKPLEFNDSHSGGLALYAVTLACPVGVDVECLRPVPEFQDIATRFFSLREAEMLMALPMESRMEGFFTCWTHKEAFLKATGEGIGQDLTKVEVKLNPRRAVEVLHSSSEPQTQTEWQWHSFFPARGYLAAIAYRHHELTLSLWRFRGPLS